MRKCVCYGCKSGYDSCTEKFHIFVVPNDKKIIRLWQIAIFRDDLKLKSGHGICEKHFREEDIIREKILYAPDGTTVVGRSPYQRPQLRKGAVPSLHLGRPEKLKSEPRKPPRKRKISNEPENSNIKKNKEEDTFPDALDNLNINNEVENNDEINSLNELFHKVYDNKENVRLPTSWGKMNLFAGENDLVVTFHNFIAIKTSGELIETIVQKEIILYKNMSVLVKFNGIRVELNSLGIENTEFDSIDKIEELIIKVDKFEVCRGCPEISRTPENEKLIQSFTYGAKTDCLRHAKCKILLPIHSKNLQCKACMSVKQVLQKKIIRRQHSRNSNYLKVSDLSPVKRMKLLKIKNELKLTTAAKNRARRRVNSLETTLWNFNKI